jgi:hypothetical protein
MISWPRIRLTIEARPPTAPHPSRAWADDICRKKVGQLSGLDTKSNASSAGPGRIALYLISMAHPARPHERPMAITIGCRTRSRPWATWGCHASTT